MRGLCTSEGEKFKNFFALVQEEVKKKDAIFFLESGDGRDFEYGDLDCADLCGWLVPEAEADEFEAIWKRNPPARPRPWYRVFRCFRGSPPCPPV